MKRDVDGILYEALVVALVGVCAALTANHFSPKGIKLTRDYFPSGAAVVADGAVDALAISDSKVGGMEARLRAKNLGLVELAEAEALFRDPQYEAEQVIFVDARGRRHYEAGHVPGAYLLDHFYPDETLPEVLAAALAADSVVVYCNGGDCEDSEFTSIFLREAGVPDDRLRVYVGGMTEWREQGLPVELGRRRSGRIEGL
jgi:rhodanese-related sulfurtransferase